MIHQSEVNYPENIEVNFPQDQHVNDIETDPPYQEDAIDHEHIRPIEKHITQTVWL